MRHVNLVGFGLFASLFVSVSGPMSPLGARGQEKAFDAEREKAEFAAIQGSWRCLRWEQDGKLMSEEDCRKVSVVVKGETYKSTVDGTNFREGELRINPFTTPHQMDATFDGGVSVAIYVRSGDYLILCVGGRRPAEFASGRERGGDSLYVFKIEPKVKDK